MSWSLLNCVRIMKGLILFLAAVATVLQQPAAQVSSIGRYVWIACCTTAGDVTLTMPVRSVNYITIPNEPFIKVPNIQACTAGYTQPLVAKTSVPHKSDYSTTFECKIVRWVEGEFAVGWRHGLLVWKQFKLLNAIAAQIRLRSESDHVMRRVCPRSCSSCIKGHAWMTS